MSVEGAGPVEGAETATAGPADTDRVVPEGRGDVRGISDLTYRIILPYLSNALLHRIVRIALLVLAAICLVATVVRLSPLPLIPIPIFAIAYWALHRSERAGDSDRALLTWSSLCLAASLIGFWALSVVGTWVS